MAKDEGKGVTVQSPQSEPRASASGNRAGSITVAARAERLPFSLFLSSAFLCVLCVLCVEKTAALINKNFTPLDLVKCSAAIHVGTLAAGTDRDQWKLTVSESLKGKKVNELPIALRTANEFTAQTVRDLLASNGAAPVIIFLYRDEETSKAWLHAGGMYLDLKLPGKDVKDAKEPWEIGAVSEKMRDVFAGGTDMLIRMARYTVSDPMAGVPVAVGVAWTRDSVVLGKLDGTVAALQAVELGGDKRPHVFVACDKGDRLYRAKKDDEAFEDVTAALGLDSKSRQSLWLDLDGAGAPELVSWTAPRLPFGRWRMANSSSRANHIPSPRLAWVWRPAAIPAATSRPFWSRQRQRPSSSIALLAPLMARGPPSPCRVARASSPVRRAR
jgi:hypothetical protein